MQAIILSVGDELVLGQTLDTNSAWISQQLAAVGIGVRAHATVGDAQADVEAALRDAVGRADTVIVSGGIGPTDDDVTRQALAAVMNVELVADASWLAHITAFFAKLGRAMPETNKIQAMVPRGAAMIWNHLGTAAGVAATLEHRFDRTRPPRRVPVFLTPGVPKEMKGMFTRDVLPALAASAGGAAIVQRTLHTFGVGESTIAEKLGDLMKRGRNPSVGTTVSGGVVSIRVNARFASVEEATQQSDGTCAEIREALGDLIYGEDGVSLAEAVMFQLRQRALTMRTAARVATAESCTGGLLAKYLTDVAGSSAHFDRGWVTYSNEAKTAELGVDAAILKRRGAVSEPVAVAMARGARDRTAARFSLAITGVAGPDGGTDDKPVGTVCIALARPRLTSGDEPDGDVLVRTFRFPGDREMVRDRSAKMALTMLRFALLGRPMPF